MTAYSTTQLNAEEIVIPVITSPSALQEGVQRELTPTQIGELLPWANDSKAFLVDLLDATRGLPVTQKCERLYDGIKQVIGESNPKNSELFMRYILNRSIALADLLAKETDANAVGSVDSKLRVLTLSIGMAITYYDIDLKNITEKKSSYAGFGIAYFNFLNELSKSIFDASAQYKISRTSLEWLQWDLYRDLNNTSYAQKIVKIHNALRIFPTTSSNDALAIDYIRQVKTVIKQLAITRESSRNNQSNTEINIDMASGKYTYFYSAETLNGYYPDGCYPKSSTGKIMWSDRLLDAHCASTTSKYYYSSETRNGNYQDGCYVLSTNGKPIYSKKVNNCGSNTYKYYQSSETRNGYYPAGCYQISTNGKPMFSEGKVISNLCM